MVRIYTPGECIADVYEVAGQPLRGAMGLVYLAYDYREQRPVALKTFHPHLIADRTARTRFLREAEIWIRLGKHPHIVRAYSVERIDGTHEVFLVLELVAKREGYRTASLRPWLLPDKPLPLELALCFALQIARGMTHAVKVVPGLVHRDLKPENVLVGADVLPGTQINRVRVTDFGLVAAARGLVGQETAVPKLRLTQTHLTQGIAGTPQYMPPEQWYGEEVDCRADIYAFGCILYEMVCGRPAVSGKSLKDLMEAHCGGKISPVPTDLPRPVGILIARCVVSESSRRYSDWPAVERAVSAVYTTVTRREAPSWVACQAPNRADRIAVGVSYNALAASYVDIGRADTALALLEQAQSIADAEHEPVLKMIVLHSRGSAHLSLGQSSYAIACSEQALNIARASGFSHEEISAMNSLAMACTGSGELHQALEWLEKAMKMSMETSDWHAQAVLLGNLGSVYKNLGDMERAIQAHEQHRGLAQAMGDKIGECNALVGLGIAHKNLGCTKDAIQYYLQALPIYRELGDREGECMTLTNLGIAYKNLGQPTRAIACYEEALPILQETANSRLEAQVLANLGKACSLLPDVDKAVHYYDRALQISRQIGDSVGEGITLDNLGLAYASLGDNQRAISCHEHALRIFQETGYRRGERDAHQNLGILCDRDGDFMSAGIHFEHALNISHEISDAFGVANSAFNLATVYARVGRLYEARSLAQQTAYIWNQIRSPMLQNAQQLLLQISSTMQRRGL